MGQEPLKHASSLSGLVWMSKSRVAREVVYNMPLVVERDQLLFLENGHTCHSRGSRVTLDIARYLGHGQLLAYVSRDSERRLRTNFVVRASDHHLVIHEFLVSSSFLLLLLFGKLDNSLRQLAVSMGKVAVGYSGSRQVLSLNLNSLLEVRIGVVRVKLHVQRRESSKLIIIIKLGLFISTIFDQLAGPINHELNYYRYLKKTFYPVASFSIHHATRVENGRNHQIKQEELNQRSNFMNWSVRDSS